MITERLLIFHINTETGLRGGEIQTLHLIRGLQERGHQNCLFARPGSRILQQAREEGLPCFTLPMRGEWDLISARTLRKFIQLQQPHLLHAHTAHSCSIALMARWPDKDPPIVFSRRVAFPSNKALLRRKLKNVDALLAVSNTVRQQLVNIGIPEEKIYVAESGTDVNRFAAAPEKSPAREQLGLPQGSFIIGNISHFDRSKGQNKLIRMFSQFLKSHPNAFLLLVGEGPEKSACEQLTRALGCEHRVLFLSYRSDVENLYPVMDVFFLSSTHEGWSGVIREAMLSGVPVIAVRQPSTEEQLTHGILVGDDPDEWLSAVERLYVDAGERLSLAKAASEHASKYTIEAMVEKTERCYRAVLK